MKGTNPIRPPVSDDGSELGVKSIFPTLQGEGPYVGIPSIFVRLGGCNLACNFCDTMFEEFETMKAEDVAARVAELAADLVKLVVITGGEPMRQNIALLCEMLVAKGFVVQVETNGTLYRELHKDVEIVCSPKNANGQYYPLRPDLLARLSAIKFLISESNENYGYVPDVGQKEYDIPVYVQPMDEEDDAKNTANYEFANKLAEAGGYQLSLQMHKIWGIP